MRRWIGSSRPWSAHRLYGNDGVGVFGGGGLTNEKAYLLGKFARVALQDFANRLQRTVLYVVGGGGVDEGFWHRSRPAVPAGGYCQSRDDSSGGQQSGGDHAAGHAVFSGAEEARGIADRSRSAFDANRCCCDSPSADHSGHGCRTGERITAHRNKRRVTSDEGFIAERTRDFEVVRRAALSYWPERVERITGIR